MGADRTHEREIPVSEKGHNTGVAGEQLQAYVDRIERLDGEKRGLAEDIK